MNIIDCKQSHYQQLADIYNYYIENTVISFEEDVLDAATFGARVEEYTKKYPWLVGEVDKQVVGYAYATKWQGRSAYRDTAEISIYLHQGHVGKGYGKPLYKAVLDKLRAQGCHVIVAGIALPNDASVKLQEHFGFEKVAHFKEVGFKHNEWIDVGYWQLTTDSQ